MVIFAGAQEELQGQAEGLITLDDARRGRPTLGGGRRLSLGLGLGLGLDLGGGVARCPKRQQRAEHLQGRRPSGWDQGWRPSAAPPVMNMPLSGVPS